MAVTEAEVESARALIGDFNDVILKHISARQLTHEDVVSALTNMLVHHAVHCEMPIEDLLIYVQEAHDHHIEPELSMLS